MLPFSSSAFEDPYIELRLSFSPGSLSLKPSFLKAVAAKNGRLQAAIFQGAMASGFRAQDVLQNSHAEGGAVTS